MNLNDLSTHYVKKTIQIGQHTGQEYIVAIKKNNERELAIVIDELTEDFLYTAEFPLSETPESVTLTFLPLTALGFTEEQAKEGCTYEDICAAGKAAGLSLCPRETVPALRLQYLNQDPGSGTNPISNILMMIEPVRLREAASFSFSVFTNDHLGVLGLCAVEVGNGSTFNDTLRRFAFILPEEKK